MLLELGLKSYVISRSRHAITSSARSRLSQEKSNRRYSEADVAVAEARRVATAIENVQLYTDAQKAIQLREQVHAIVSGLLRRSPNRAVPGPAC